MLVEFSTLLMGCKQCWEVVGWLNHTRHHHLLHCPVQVNGYLTSLTLSLLLALALLSVPHPASHSLSK